MIQRMREVVEKEKVLIEAQYRKGVITGHEYNQAVICHDKILTALDEMESSLALLEMIARLERGDKL